MWKIRQAEAGKGIRRDFGLRFAGVFKVDESMSSACPPAPS